MVAFAMVVVNKSILYKRLFMNILHSWKESLGLLWPHKLRPFLMVTAKTVLDIYRALNKPLTSRGNWIVVALLALLIGLTNVIKMFHLFFVEELLLNSMLHFLVFIFALEIRPSVARKDEAYFVAYIKERWYLLVLTILLGVLPVYYIPLSFIWYMLFLFFALDTKGSVSELMFALKSSVKMLVYNLPLFVVIWAVVGLITVIMNFFVAFALYYFGGLTFAFILYILFVPIQIALIDNVYVKLLHDQPSLYFKQPE